MFVDCIRLLCLRLLQALACDYKVAAVPVLVADPAIVCWQGRHRYLAAAALTALCFYVPLSIMVAPMLMEAPPRKASWGSQHAVRHSAL